jgi:IS5 family transposase
MPIWRDFLRLLAELVDTGEIQVIDATSMDSVGASHHYANRTNYTFKAVKTTFLIDCKTSMILDIHCLMKQPRDSQVRWQLLTRNLDKLSVLTADKGYDWELLRQKPSEGVKPVIKYSEFGWNGVANNILLNDTTYHKRSNVESSFLRFGAHMAGSFERGRGSHSSANSF